MKSFHRQNHGLGWFDDTKFSRDWNSLFDKLEKIPTRDGRAQYLFDNDADYQNLKSEYDTAEAKHREHMRSKNMRQSVDALSLRPSSPAVSQRSVASGLANCMFKNATNPLKSFYKAAKHRFASSS